MPGLFEVMADAINIMQGRITRGRMAGAHGSRHRPVTGAIVTFEVRSGRLGARRVKGCSKTHAAGIGYGIVWSSRMDG